MNVTFRLPSEELEKRFLEEAHESRTRRPEGPPFGRRLPGIHLQRRRPGGRRCPGGVHERLREAKRVRRRLSFSIYLDLTETHALLQRQGFELKIQFLILAMQSRSG
ncbi:MAG: hypothetical protein MZV70_68585 [Desulfobacterales bacterium]|nr:hypothetical protein [Desulfobacterales bacterium]